MKRRMILTWTVLIGGLPTVASLLIAHCIRGEGNTKQASIGVSYGAVLNIILDSIWGEVGLVMSQPVADTVALVIGLVLYRRMIE